MMLRGFVSVLSLSANIDEHVRFIVVSEQRKIREE